MYFVGGGALVGTRGGLSEQYGRAVLILEAQMYGHTTPCFGPVDDPTLFDVVLQCCCRSDITRERVGEFECRRSGHHLYSGHTNPSPFCTRDRTLYDVNRNILIIEKLREGPRGRLISDHITVPLSSVHEKYRTHLDERGLHRSEQISPRGHSRGKCQIECLEYAIGCHHRHQRPIKED